MSGEFWGLKVEPTKTYTQDVTRPFRLTNVALGEETKAGRTILYAQVGEDSFPLASLSTGACEQALLDTYFGEGQTVSFFQSGPNPIFITGHYLEEDGDLCCEDEDCEGCDVEDLAAEDLADDAKAAQAEMIAENEDSEEDDDFVPEEGASSSEEEEDSEMADEEAAALIAEAEAEGDLEEVNTEDLMLTPEQEQEALAELKKIYGDSMTDEEILSEMRAINKAIIEGNDEDFGSDVDYSDVDEDMEFGDPAELEEITEEEARAILEAQAKVIAEAKKEEAPKKAEAKKAEAKKAETKKAETKKAETKKAEPAKPAEAKKAEPAKKEAPAKVESRTLPSGLKIDILEKGTGLKAKSGKRVSMRYIGKLTNGKVFDSNTKGSPFSFRLGAGEVIKGWDQGIAGMHIGERRRLTIPPALAYGSRGAPPDIPRNATLVFEVKLLNVK